MLVISDLHIPYQHKDAFAFLAEIKKEFKPDFVVNIGDLLDFHSMSMHDHDPDLASPGDEMTIAREYVKELEWMFPKVVEVESNHSSMVFRRALKSSVVEGGFNCEFGVGSGGVMTLESFASRISQINEVDDG